MLNAYRTFVRWRRAQPALRGGGIRLFPSPEGTFVFLREHEGSGVLACFNFGAQPADIRIPVPGTLEPLSGHGFAASTLAQGSVTVPAHGVFFAAAPARPAPG